jgi:subtilisin family serine protease
MSGVRVRFVFGFLASLACLLFAGAASTEDELKPKLSKHDQGLLAQLRADGKRNATLLVATVEGQTAAVAERLRALGADIGFRDDEFGYLRVIVPLDRASAVAATEGVQATDVDEVFPVPNLRPEGSVAGSGRLGPQVDPPGEDTPALNPYLPTQDIGAPQFVAENPTYDGRGITIGIVDTGIDLLTPELQTGKRLDGSSVPKFVDSIVATDPVLDGDPTWLPTDPVTATNGKFSYEGKEYTAPGNGEFRIGLLIEKNFPFPAYPYGSDLNRDQDEVDVFGVLWKFNNRVWVDSDSDLDFSDEKELRPYHINHDIGVLGTDDQGTEMRESVAFTVQVDRPSKRVNIGLVTNLHGTHVAGIAAGKSLFGGEMDGAAPEARIVAVRACVQGCTAHGMTEGMIFAVRNSDVVSMSIGGVQPLNDGNNARALIYNRLILNKNVQMFIAAGNDGVGENTVSDPSVVTRAMSIGASITKETWLSNYGADVARPEQMFVFSSRGPREDGGFKPSIAAPGAAVSTIPKFLLGQSVPESGYTLPPGYGMFNGTSMATPQSSGGAALLLSAAAQNGFTPKASALRQAIDSSGRPLEGFGVFEQGNGVMDVGAAWELLESNSIDTVAMASRAPVNTVMSGFLKNPHQGPGIHEREGWKAGDTRERTITLTRTGPGDGTYNLSWVGNDGTFASSVQSVTLRHDQPVSVPVTVSTATAGVHSAILNVDEPATPGIDYQVLNTVVAAEQLGPENNFTKTIEGEIDRTNNQSYFFNVTPGTLTFKVDLQVLAGRLRLNLFDPAGMPVTRSAFCTTPCSWLMAPQNPMPGVWEVSIDSSRTSPVQLSEFEVTATLQGVAVEPQSWTIDPATIGQEYEQTFSFENLHGTYTGHEAGTALASTLQLRPTIVEHAEQWYEVAIPAGSTQLRVTTGNTSDPGTDLDVYVFDPNGNQAGSDTSPDADELVIIENPMEGTWRIRIHAFAIPTGQTEYDYLDAVSHPMFGGVTLPNVVEEHPNGDTWERTATAVANAAPAAGRFLQGFVQVQSEDGAVLGEAEVQMRNLSQAGLSSARPGASAGGR